MKLMNILVAGLLLLGAAAVVVSRFPPMGSRRLQ